MASIPEEPHPARKLLSPGDLKRAVAAFIEHYNHLRYHASVNNLTRPISTSGVAGASSMRATN
jgi:hypothetical protein